MTKEHVNYVKAHKAHRKSVAGCIVYCTSMYEPGNSHSHRWNAAKRARGEKRVPYNDYGLFTPKQIWRGQKSMKYLTKLKAAGLVVGSISPTPDGKLTATVKPFSTYDTPFKHNAHHIIPSSELEAVIDKVVAKAAPNEGRMRDLVIGGLLMEPYNNNGQPNMIVLPLKLADSRVLGLPIHTDGQADHPDYRRSCATQLTARVQSKYVSLASAVAAETHPVDQNVPALKDTLESLSNAIYEAIISLAQARVAKNKIDKKSLDDVRAQLMRAANATLSK